MTATRRTPNRSGAKKKPPTKAASKRSPATRSSTSRARKPAAPPVRPPFTVRMLESLGAASRGHRADFAGIFMIVVGLVAGLGIYLRGGGPVGRLDAELVGTLVGAARIFAPVVLVLLGILLIRGVPEERQPTDGDDPTRVDGFQDDLADHPFARVVLGSTLMAIAGLGLLHLFRSAPGFSDGRDAMADSAGYVGAVIGAPLRG
ncbi:MAG: hypothetical protein ABIP03_00740, partial [Aquihabitans sp.]